MEDLTGKQFGPYQIVAPLGEGGMAAVYKAYHPAMERYVALKVLPRHFASDPQFVARFKQEAKVLAQLQHPHILAVFDFGEADGYTYLVMPFIKSGTLTDWLKRERLTLFQIRATVTQIGNALDYAHARGLLHRDVKPSNVLIDESGNCLLTDFGLAKIIESTNASLTTSGAIMGTPIYMSPEQGLGQRVDKRSDIYALGVILYEMATGRVPYNAETPMAVVIKHINDPLPIPHLIQPDLPESVERVILKSLAKNAEDRYQTAGEMVRALEAAVAEAKAAPTIAPTAPVTMPVVVVPTSTETAAPVTGTVAHPASATAQLPLSALPAEAPLAEAAQVKPSATLAPSAYRWAVIITAIGWAIGILVGLLLSAGLLPLGGAIAGAVGGLSIGLAWKRLAPVTRKQLATLSGYWAIAGSVALLAGPLFFLIFAVAGWLTARTLRQAEPALTRRHMGWITAGWGLGWLIGGLMFSFATQLPNKPLSGVFVVAAFLLAGGIGGAVTFGQWRAVRGSASPSKAKASPWKWLWIVGGAFVCLLLAAIVVIGGKAINDRRAAAQTATAATLTPIASPTVTIAPPRSSVSATAAAPTPVPVSVKSGMVTIVSDLPMLGMSLGQSQGIINSVQMALDER